MSGYSIMPAPLLLTAARLAVNLEMLRESLTVLLVIAVPTATILVLAIAFLLLKEGIRHAIRWAKTRYIRIAALSHKH
jgi:hypothetical protein